MTERPGKLAGSSKPVEAASDWLVRRDRGDLSPEEEAEFRQWLAEPANAEAYRRAQQTWAIFDDCEGDQHLRALRRAAQDAEREAIRSRRFKRMSMTGIAACLALIVAGGMLMGGNGEEAVRMASVEETAGQQGADPAEMQNQTHSTRKGERLAVTLPDGTGVTLNTNTSLEVAYSAGERRVYLRQGQAYFEVAHDPDRPFAVLAADTRVVALGTQFDVRLDPSHFQVTLAEGRVSVQRGHMVATEAETALQEVILEPGQKLTASLGVAARVSEVDVDRQLMWREGFVEFDDVLLEAAVAEMNRYSRDPVIIEDPRVASLRLSGVFRTGQLDRFLEIVADLLPVEVERGSNRGIELKWAGA